MSENTEVPEAALPRVAVIGKPNVGKSALFNCMLGRQHAIVYDEPGMTRDRLYRRCQWMGVEYVAIDTGGMIAEIYK